MRRRVELRLASSTYTTGEWLRVFQRILAVPMLWDLIYRPQCQLYRPIARPLLPKASASHPPIKHTPPSGVTGPRNLSSGLSTRAYMDPEKPTMPAMNRQHLLIPRRSISTSHAVEIEPTHQQQTATSHKHSSAPPAQSQVERRYESTNNQESVHHHHRNH